MFTNTMRLEEWWKHLSDLRVTRISFEHKDDALEIDIERDGDPARALVVLPGSAGIGEMMEITHSLFKNK